ncbi:carbohydrate esterase family 9 protein [Mycena rosella]|uniref:Carbohydrate esterase family 9 protein n=1 Tax=Mycena rosella TaxID=1033263 RepID=A0AAD7D943_MYCRO|nr:carbohydrate esterase family 9 protein [Mycena rosella]
MDLSRPARSRLLVFLVSLVALSYNLSDYLPDPNTRETTRLTVSQEIQAKCRAIQSPAGPSPVFLKREVSDRFEVGTNSTLITNATILTGRGNDTHVMHGDLYLHMGLVKAIGSLSHRALENAFNLTVINAMGAWVTPGLVDIHTHLGLMSAPFMAGGFDVSSRHGPILPWLRNIDGLNTHDDGFQLAIAGGVTSVQVLSSSVNNIGGQASFVKLRRTSTGSSSFMLVEPPYNFNRSAAGPPRWRHLQQSCERGYGNRPDSIWALRAAYSEARKIRTAQDAFCSNVEAGLWDPLVSFPEDAQWEMLVDVLRGKVKVVTSECQGAVDIDALVRLTNEFEFPVASLQTASEAWLIPEVLNRTWGGSPSVALLILGKRYNYQSYRGSEFAPRVLADVGIPVIMKSAHPVVNSRYLLSEAQQAYFYGLPPYLALASITSVPAAAAGLEHRIGSLHEGADADVVLWDGNPLQLGATPLRVWIDGALQIPVPRSDREGTIDVGEERNGFPDVPDWDKEREQALKYEGLPPLTGRKQGKKIVFINVREVCYNGADGRMEQVIQSGLQLLNVVVENGKIRCVGDDMGCPLDAFDADEYVDLDGGSVSPGMMTFGSSLGLEEIQSEPSTGDGSPFDAFMEKVPGILHDPGAVVAAVDGLVFGTRHALTAYRAGVTYGTTSVMKPLGGNSVIGGVSTVFCTGSAHAMEQGAIIQTFAALHVGIHRAHPLSRNRPVSVSSQIAGLRRLLYGWESQETETGKWFKRAAEGVVPLVIEVGNADIMATLLILKAEVENQLGSRMRMVFSGAAEASMLAKEISEARVGVILDAKPTVGVWEERRILPGPPLTNDTTLVALIRAGVKVGLKCSEPQQVRNMRFDLTWAMLTSNGRISETEAHALVSSNLQEMLGVTVETADLVAYTGGSVFEASSKVVAVISAQRGRVDVFGAA